MLLYWTFVPGFHREVYILLKYAYFTSQHGTPGFFTPASLLDIPQMLHYLAAVSRLALGQQYVPAGLSFRYIDQMVRLSLPLEVLALGSALSFYAACNWFRVQTGARAEKRRKWSVFSLVHPWTAWAVYRIVCAVVLPDAFLEDDRTSGLVA